MADSKRTDYFPIDSFWLPRNFLRDPLMCAIKLARYKFVAKILAKDDIVLDLGCGNGYGSYFFAKFAKEVIGIDLYADIPSVAKQMIGDNLSFIQGDILSPPSLIMDKQFSAVTMVDVIEHFYKEDGEAIIQRYINLLSDNGVMIIGTPSKYTQAFRSTWSKDTHFHEYEPDELDEICQKYFSRTIMFSMNDEIVHTGFNKLAWFIFLLCFK